MKTKRPHILVVDDEPGLRAMLAWELTDQGMEVHSAGETHVIIATGFGTHVAREKES
jgi:DNA-binding response OmpR family regulator